MKSDIVRARLVIITETFDVSDGRKYVKLIKSPVIDMTEKFITEARTRIADQLVRVNIEVES